MRGRTFHLWLWLLLLLLEGRVDGAAPLIVGGVRVHIPPPEGCLRSDGRHARADLWQGGVTPEGNRLLATFAPREDVRKLAQGELPPLRRAFSAQTYRALEETVLTSEAFAYLQRTLREQMGPGKRSVAAWAIPLEARNSALLAQQAGSPVQVKLAGRRSPSVLAETPDSLCFVLEVPIVATGDALEYPVETSAVVAACTLRVCDRLLFLQVSSEAEEPADAEWVQEQIVQWRDRVLAANAPGSGYVEAPEEDLLDERRMTESKSSSTRFINLISLPRQRVVLGAMAAAVFVGLLSLVTHWWRKR